MAGSSTFFVLSPGLPEDFYDAIKLVHTTVIVVVPVAHNLYNMHKGYGSGYV